MMDTLNKIIFRIFGMRLTSSQCGEDLILESFLSGKNGGYYVDIGANHPFKYSNTRLFYGKGWTGINIEPNPQKLWLFKLFRRKDINLDIGIGEIPSQISFYVFEEHTLCTFDKNSAENFKKMGHKLNKILQIKVCTLSDVLNKYAKNREIDFMSVDTEGFDLNVLKSNDWQKFRPRLIIVETLEYQAHKTGKKLSDTYDTYMNSIGYRKVADTYINTIYEKIY